MADSILDFVQNERQVIEGRVRRKDTDESVSEKVLLVQDNDEQMSLSIQRDVARDMQDIAHGHM